jgi:fructose-1,6-bisphosphatase/inositol monophosphatase family enzyme
VTFDEKQIDDLADLVADVARWEIMPRFRRLDRGEIREKTSAADLVTEADVNAERAITAELLARFPASLVIGEEACSDDPSRLDALEGAELAFVVDPVDGTFNFASGAPLFGMMLAVVVKGETVAGIIHDPVGRDAAIAIKGGGAFIRTSEGVRQPCRVASPVAIGGMTGSVSWQYADPAERFVFARNHAKCLSQVGYRCAAHEYRLLGTGDIHFALYNKLMPWDHLAGVLLHAEAGGFARCFDGSEYRPGRLDGGLLVAPDPDSWAMLRRELWES